MKLINRKTLAALLAIALLAVSSIGIAVAYFSDTDRAEGAVTLDLQGKTTIDEGESSTEKNVTITNVGNCDVVVRVAFFGPSQMKVTNSGDWIDGGDGFYYYKNLLAPGDSTPKGALVAAVSMNDKEAAEMGDSFQVTVVQECSPLVYEDGKAATVAGWTLPVGVVIE